MSDNKKLVPPSDPNLTLDVRNEEVEAALKLCNEAKSPENINTLVNKLRDARVLVPANINEQKQPYPVVIKNNNGDIFIPVYTNKEEIPDEPKAPAIINFPFLTMVEMGANPDLNVKGIVINAFSNNIVFPVAFLQNILEVEKARAEGRAPKVPQGKKIELTPEQFAVLERTRFEKGLMPDKFFENPTEFIERITSEREEYVDVLFEESYREKRMYPYLTEDFSVMPMSVSEGFTVIRVDFPTRDMGTGVSVRAYLTYDKEKDSARYYLIESLAPKKQQLSEIKDHKLISHGPAPVEGAELQLIIDLSK